MPEAANSRPEPGPAEQRTRALRDKAQELGFHKLGVASVGPIDPDRRLRRWLEQGHHASMDYMAERVAEREDVTRAVPGARSVVVLAMSYHRPGVEPHPTYKVSRYALGDDYHRIIQKKVRKLRKFLLQSAPDASVKPTVDTAPVLERAWAARAGIGWVGKSTMVLSEDLGTYFFLATLITDLELVYDAPVADRCGSCTRCLDACPTDAFVEPFVLDARRCIAFWTVEAREAPTSAGVDPHGWVAGCDVCQEVCPWNKFARPTDEPRFQPRAALLDPVQAGLQTPGDWDQAAQGTALQRTGGEALHRNARRVDAQREGIPAPDTGAGKTGR